MTSKEIRKNIITVEKEISSLREQHNQLDEELISHTNGIASGEADSDARAKIRSLKTDKDVLDEVLQRKKKQLTVLNNELDLAIGQETDVEEYQKLISMIEKADKLQTDYYKKAKLIDDLLKKHVGEFVQIWNKWKNHNSKTLHFAETIAKGFQVSTIIRYGKEGRSNELTAKDLIDRIEKDGASFDSVLNGEATSERYWEHVRTVKDFDKLLFTYHIMQMKNSPVVDKLLTKETESV
jgi:hypothetical protein